MKRTLLLVVVCLWSLISQAQTHRVTRTTVPRTPLKIIAQALPIRRVILYSNGVAYVERRGTVLGHAEINLSFKQSQVDDVLKSMVVLDLGQGRIGAVSYNSSAPTAARLADIPFSIEVGTAKENRGGLAAVLSQLQGARVLISSAARTATGSILTVEERASEDANRTPIKSYALVIVSEGGDLVSFDLADVRSVKLMDDGTRHDVQEFANASASARRRDAKTIVVTSDGNGSREMVVSYIIAAPIWKTTYRVVLDAQGKPFFQGWAIVDNVSEEDWNNVSLSLISGSPVSFIQTIQKPFYRYRPIVGIPEDLKLQPQTYEPSEGVTAGTISGTITDPNGAVVPGATVTITNTATNQSSTSSSASDGTFRSPALESGTYSVRVNAQGFKSYLLQNVIVGSGLPVRANVTLEVGGITEMVTVTAGAEIINQTSASVSKTHRLPPTSRAVNGLANFSSLDGISISDAITRPDSGVEAAATGAEVGDLFEYRIDQPVTVPHDRSALIPILQTRLEGERVSIYNEGARTDRPMVGLLLKNTSPLTLETGALTVIDGNAYAGEALMERLKPAEQRLISFALDLGTLVNVRTKEDRAPTFMVRTVKGVFQAHYYQTTQKVYALTNQTDKQRVVMIEHPLREGWTLASETPQPEGKTASYYRFRVTIEPHQKIDFPVTERRMLMETYTLANFSRSDLDLFIARGYLDREARTGFEKIIELRTRVADTSARVAAIDDEVSEIGKDQERLRDNIKALTATAEAKQLIIRYVSKADSQETRLEQLNKEKQALSKEIENLQAQLDAMISTFAINRSLSK